MAYANLVVYERSNPDDPDSVERFEVPPDDTWILANKPSTLLLTADKATITAADPPVDYATVTVQLQTPELMNGSRQNINRSGVVSIMVGDGKALVELLNGVGAFQVDSIGPGTFEIEATNMASNVITVEAV